MSQSSAIILMKRSQTPRGYNDVLTVNTTAPTIQVKGEFQPQLLKKPQPMALHTHQNALPPQEIK